MPPLHTVTFARTTALRIGAQSPSQGAVQLPDSGSKAAGGAMPDAQMIEEKHQGRCALIAAVLHAILRRF
jgi:hypothetical protein